MRITSLSIYKYEYDIVTPLHYSVLKYLGIFSKYLRFGMYVREKSKKKLYNFNRTQKKHKRLNRIMIDEYHARRVNSAVIISCNSLIFSHEFLMEFFEFGQHLFQFIGLGQDCSTEMICAWSLPKATAGHNANTCFK